MQISADILSIRFFLMNSRWDFLLGGHINSLMDPSSDGQKSILASCTCKLEQSQCDLQVKSEMFHVIGGLLLSMDKISYLWVI